MRKTNETQEINEIDSNINSTKTELKLAVNKSLYLKGVITEEMYIKAKEALIRAPMSNIQHKKRGSSLER